MARYIDADKLIKRINAWSNTEYDKWHTHDIISAIYLTPTADVIEVVHAQNIAGFVYENHCEFKCSRCGADAGEIAYGSMDGAKVNYCPNCSAFIGDGTKWDGTFGGDYETKGWEAQNDA